MADLTYGNELFALKNMSTDTRNWFEDRCNQEGTNLFVSVKKTITSHKLGLDELCQHTAVPTKALEHIDIVNKSNLAVASR